MRGCHFISGLPRSGSTLLSAILNQNPEFKAHIISPVAELFQLTMLATGAHNESYPLFNDLQRAAILTGIFNSYHEPLGDTGQIIFDSNRSWCARMNLIAELFPNARVIVCVRDPAIIFESLERLTRSNPLLFSKLYQLDSSASVFTRADYQISPKGMIRYAWNAARDAYYGPYRERLIIVDYDDLASYPHNVLAMIYAKLNLTYQQGQHDFENVKLDGVEAFDNSLGVPGLHTVRPKVELFEHASLLPPEIAHMFSWPLFWKR